MYFQPPEWQAIALLFMKHPISGILLQLRGQAQTGTMHSKQGPAPKEPPRGHAAPRPLGISLDLLHLLRSTETLYSPEHGSFFIPVGPRPRAGQKQGAA